MIVVEITTSTHRRVCVLIAVALERISMRAYHEPRPDREPGRLCVDDTDQGEVRVMYHPPVSPRAFPHRTHPSGNEKARPRQSHYHWLIVQTAFILRRQFLHDQHSASSWGRPGLQAVDCPTGADF